MISFEDLAQRIRAYDPAFNEQLLLKAYGFGLKAHEGQTRASGDPFFAHPIEVAALLTEYKLDLSTLITALLHDTVEDTAVTLDEVESLFGQEIRFLVDGVTKLTKLELQSIQSKQAENFRKLLLAMSADIRVLLVKLADRLHNMRTLDYFPSEEKRKRISAETMEIYAPLSERIGMHHLKDELEDLAFKQLNPDAYHSIVARLNYLKEKESDVVSPIIQELTEVLQDHGLGTLVSGREKAPYSIWKKMKEKNISFEQLSDIIAFRIVVDTVQQCYQALGIVHSTYPVVPGRFKDYISTPKANNYRSIHTTVIGPFKHRVEVQIRTKEMHEIAEFGLAAHWQYKQAEQNTDGQKYKWLRELLDILDNASSPEEFLEHTKLEMFQDQVFCFSPKGDLITLPRGSCPIDFAYAVHSNVGNHCIGSRINGKMMPLRTALENGDQVEIITSKSQTPSPTWERYVATGKARVAIRKYVRTQQRSQYIDLGRSLVIKACKQESGNFSEKNLEERLLTFNFQTLEDLYASVGAGLTPLTTILSVLYPNTEAHPSPPLEKPRSEKKEHAVTLKGLIPGMAIHYAGCCHPLPGDDIIGVIVTGKGVTVHTQDCEQLQQHGSTSEHWIPLNWNDDTSQEKHVGRLNAMVTNQTGSIATLTTIIAKAQGNILNFRIKHRNADFFEILVDVEVSSLSHLQEIMAALRMSPRLISVDRT